MLFPLVLALSLSAAPADGALSAASGHAHKQVLPIADGADGAYDGGDTGRYEDDVGLLERVFAFTLPASPEDEVDENLFVFFLGGVLFGCAGNVWLPALLVGGPAPPGYWSDALLAWIIHVAIIFAVDIVLIIVSAFYAPIAAVTSPIMALVVLVHAFYLTPVAVMNAYDRALKRQRGGSRKKRKESGKRGFEPAPEPAGPVGEPPPPLEDAPDALDAPPSLLPSEEEIGDPSAPRDPAGPERRFLSMGY